MTFLFPSRLARLAYFVRNLAFGIATWPLVSILEEEAETAASLRTLGLLLLTLTLIGYWLVFIVLPRCKDAGMSWKWIFLTLIPFVNAGFGLILLFSKSKPLLEEQTPNQALQPTAPSGRG
jgi:uncharacterized membrane protein YhaH (DUF805 family)